MAAGGKPFLRYHYFLNDLAIVQHKKDKFSLQNSYNTLHDYCFSLVTHSNDVFARRHVTSASRTLFCLISRSVIDFISGSLGLYSDAEENISADNFSYLRFNIFGIDRWHDNLLLSRSGQGDVAKLFSIGNGCVPDLKASSSNSCSGSLKFQVEKSIQLIPLSDLYCNENTGISFLSSIQNISSSSFLESDKGHGCRGKVQCPGVFARGLICDSRRPYDCLKEQCWFGKRFKGHICPRFDVAKEFQCLSFVLNGIQGVLEIIPEKLKGRPVNNISNILRPDDLRAQSIFKPLNIVIDKYCKELTVSMNDLGRNSVKERTAGVLSSSAKLTQSKLHHCLKLLQLKKFSSITSEGISDPSKSLEKYVLPVSSSLGKEAGKGKFDDRLAERVSGLGSSEHPSRIDTHSERANFQSSYPKPGTNALAGALAGTFVSVWLHPIDTVKTVIQSRSVGHRSVFRNLGSILSERGAAGLYRGIGSNLASSAPISGIYTFTYESVKAALLPHFAKEYHAFAHCIAGGCASLATSFIYTPTDCIKQQMQVGSQYRNSWMALTSVLEKGGVPLLYAGWGAVLCRNVPQSVIKFYTYEGLKHFALHNDTADKQLSTLQTLVFGGLAGSTAALFTTPFDVIKTRLQTQIPGSPTYYEGVFQAFGHIAKQEGLGGLYRGLLPRLVIYISQGALFFASYEFLKRVLSIEVRRLAIQTSQSRGTSNMSQSTVAEST